MGPEGLGSKPLVLVLNFVYIGLRNLDGREVGLFLGRSGPRIVIHFVAEPSCRESDRLTLGAIPVVNPLTLAGSSRLIAPAFEENPSGIVTIICQWKA